MRSPKKGREPRLTLSDLGPKQVIDCMVCEKSKAQEGSKKFHAQHVCFECIQKINATVQSKSHDKSAKNDAQRVF